MIYKRVELRDGEPVQYLGVYCLHWKQEWGEPEVGFAEVEGEKNNSRFTDNGDGTVTDRLTGLMWLKDANYFGLKTWQEAINSVAKGNNWTTEYKDWRLPMIKELFSLVDHAQYNPALPKGHPFINVRNCWYWSCSIEANVVNRDYVWSVYMGDGYVCYDHKEYAHYVWSVRKIELEEWNGGRLKEEEK